jgi:hypothetical protein
MKGVKIGRDQAIFPEIRSFIICLSRKLVAPSILYRIVVIGDVHDLQESTRCSATTAAHENSHNFV